MADADRQGEERVGGRTVSGFRQILLWPLMLHAADGGVPTYEAMASRLEGGPRRWQRGRGAGDSSPWPVEEKEEYARFVYFHPFIQRSSIDRRADSAGVWHRRDVRAVEVRLDPEGTSLHLAVERLELHYLEVGVAVLLLEVRGRAALALDTVHDLLDRLRRAYPPYWEDGRPGHYPALVRWLDERGAPLGARSCGVDAGRFAGQVSASGHAPVDDHWRWLLEPLDCAGYAPPAPRSSPPNWATTASPSWPGSRSPRRGA